MPAQDDSKEAFYVPRDDDPTPYEHGYGSSDDVIPSLDFRARLTPGTSSIVPGGRRDLVLHLRDRRDGPGSTVAVAVAPEVDPPFPGDVSFVLPRDAPSLDRVSIDPDYATRVTVRVKVWRGTPAGLYPLRLYVTRASRSAKMTIEVMIYMTVTDGGAR